MCTDIIDAEIEQIAKLYSYMPEEEKQDWTMIKAKKMYEDELKVSKSNNSKCLLKNINLIYKVIGEFIEQDRETI